MIGMTIALGHPEGDRRVVPIVSVYVTPSERRQGVAERLLSMAEEWVRDLGGSRTSLWVEEQNVSALAFYVSVGYIATLDRHQMTSSPETWEMRLEKALTPAG
jgi:GNAT superfamily N-acetyltransferase